MVLRDKHVQMINWMNDIERSIAQCEVTDESIDLTPAKESFQMPVVFVGQDKHSNWADAAEKEATNSAYMKLIEMSIW